MDLKVGDCVHHQPTFYGKDEWENGIIKEVRENQPGLVWAVYNCNGEWSRYMNYTGACTHIEDLKLGWRSKNGPQEIRSELKAWIDAASYDQLLKRWRFAPLGDPVFQDEIGQYYANVMAEKRKEIDSLTAVKISKQIGWTP
jgi:hypothetical protein